MQENPIKRSFPPISKEDIELKSAFKITESTKMLTLLAYKNARVDMNMLDEIIGPENWTNDHYIKHETAYCRIGIWDSEKNVFVYKEDAGGEFDMAPGKGAASDAFKRAGFRWGIGRELYNSPVIKVYIKKGDAYFSNGKGTLNKDRFHVSDYEVNDDKIITKMIICDDDGEVRFRYENGASRIIPVDGRNSSSQAKPQPATQPENEKKSATQDNAITPEMKNILEQKMTGGDYIGKTFGFLLEESDATRNYLKKLATIAKGEKLEMLKKIFQAFPDKHNWDLEDE